MYYWTVTMTKSRFRLSQMGVCISDYSSPSVSQKYPIREVSPARCRFLESKVFDNFQKSLGGYQKLTNRQKKSMKTCGVQCGEKPDTTKRRRERRRGLSCFTVDSFLWIFLFFFPGLVIVLPAPVSPPLANRGND
jgi:hypothetical protein